MIRTVAGSYMYLMDTRVFGPLGCYSTAMWSSEETPVTSEHSTSLWLRSDGACARVREASGSVRFEETEVSARSMIESANRRHPLRRGGQVILAA